MGVTVALLLTYVSSYGYVALFFLILISGTYVPIPGGIILIAVGALAHEGYINILISFLVALAGSMASDLITFYIARHFGKNSAYKKYVENHKFAKRIESFAQRYPKATIVVSRFVGVASTPVNALMGLSQVRLSTFLSMDALGNAICTIIYLTVGYLIGMSAAQGTHFTNLISIAIGVVAVFYIAIFVLTQFILD